MYGLCQHLKPVSGCIWSFSTGMKSCSGWKFGAFWLVQVTRKIIGRFSKEEVTIVTIDEGELKSESWLEKWQSGKLCTASRVQSFSPFCLFRFSWSRVVFAKYPASSPFGMESHFARVLEDEILAINEATVQTNHQESYEIRLVSVYCLVENYFLVSCNKVIKIHLANGKIPEISVINTVN